MPEDYRLTRAREILAEMADVSTAPVTVSGYAELNGRAMYALETVLGIVGEREADRAIAETTREIDQLLKVAEANTRRILTIVQKLTACPDCKTLPNEWRPCPAHAGPAPA
jgi:hypothetical protein